MVKEKKTQVEIQLAFNKGRRRLWRNDNGICYQARNISRCKDSMILVDPKVMHYGLCKDSSDLVGFTSVTITPEMIGAEIAIFTAIEVKSEEGRLTEGQSNFIKMVNNFGGISFVARSLKEAEKEISDAVERFRSRQSQG